MKKSVLTFSAILLSICVIVNSCKKDSAGNINNTEKATTINEIKANVNLQVEALKFAINNDSDKYLRNIDVLSMSYLTQKTGIDYNSKLIDFKSENNFKKIIAISNEYNSRLKSGSGANYFDSLLNTVAVSEKAKTYLSALQNIESYIKLPEDQDSIINETNTSKIVALISAPIDSIETVAMNDMTLSENDKYVIFVSLTYSRANIENIISYMQLTSNVSSRKSWNPFKGLTLKRAVQIFVIVVPITVVFTGVGFTVGGFPGALVGFVVGVNVGGYVINHYPFLPDWKE